MKRSEKATDLRLACALGMVSLLAMLAQGALAWLRASIQAGRSPVLSLPQPMMTWLRYLASSDGLFYRASWLQIAVVWVCGGLALWLALRRPR